MARKKEQYLVVTRTQTVRVPLSTLAEAVQYDGGMASIVPDYEWEDATFDNVTVRVENEEGVVL